LGSQTLANTARPNSHVLSQRHSGFFSAPVNGQSTHQLKACGVARDSKLLSIGQTHSWFRGLDFNTIHLQTPPFVPDLRTESDTRYFEDNISPEPLAPADGANPEATKDPILRHKEHGKHIMEVRKSTAFAG
jgi:protein-serine/threonine kinase